jgi:hypothetical protein
VAILKSEAWRPEEVDGFHGSLDHAHVQVVDGALFNVDLATTGFEGPAL